MAVVVTIDGITGDGKGDYVSAALGEAGVKLGSYEKVIFLNIEKIFDKKIMGWLSLFLFPFKFIPGVRKLEDKYMDVVRFYYNKKKRIEICRYIRTEINKLTRKYGDVDVYAHSLGTVALLSTKVKVRNVHLFGSPLGFGLTPLRKFARNNAKRFIDQFTCHQLTYWHGPKDFVAKKVGEGLWDVLNLATFDKCSLYESDSNHSMLEYAKDFKRIYVNK